MLVLLYNKLMCGAMAFLNYSHDHVHANLPFHHTSLYNTLQYALLHAHLKIMTYTDYSHQTKLNDLRGQVSE